MQSATVNKIPDHVIDPTLLKISREAQQDASMGKNVASADGPSGGGLPSLDKLIPMPQNSAEDKLDPRSFVTRSKTKQERLAAVGGKSGNQGRFQGETQEYFNGKYKEYSRINKQIGTKNKAEDLSTFWATLRDDFWDKFTVADARVGLEGQQHKSDSQVMTETNQVSE